MCGLFHVSTMKKWWWLLSSVFVSILLSFTVVLSSLFAFFSTPAFAFPQVDHYHFRLQILNNGEPINFADSRFQKEQPVGVCSGGLSPEPFHFHDSEDQLVHVHWRGMTGAQLLKYYGWSTGGLGDVVGYRFDTFPTIQRVSPYTNALQSLQGKRVWIYTGDETSYEKRSWSDFLTKPIDDFFGKKSVIRQNAEQTSWLETPVYAHNENLATNTTNYDEATAPKATVSKQYTKEELEQINDLVGNLVLFVQESEPTAGQITQRFQLLVPLKATVCGG